MLIRLKGAQIAYRFGPSCTAAHADQDITMASVQTYAGLGLAYCESVLDGLEQAG
jgi:hypothetical protein